MPPKNLPQPSRRRKRRGGTYCTEYSRQKGRRCRVHCSDPESTNVVHEACELDVLAHAAAASSDQMEPIPGSFAVNAQSFVSQHVQYGEMNAGSSSMHLIGSPGPSAVPVLPSQIPLGSVSSNAQFSFVDAAASGNECFDIAFAEDAAASGNVAAFAEGAPASDGNECFGAAFADDTSVLTAEEVMDLLYNTDGTADDNDRLISLKLSVLRHVFSVMSLSDVSTSDESSDTDQESDSFESDTGTAVDQSAPHSEGLGSQHSSQHASQESMSSFDSQLTTADDDDGAVDVCSVFTLLETLEERTYPELSQLIKKYRESITLTLSRPTALSILPLLNVPATEAGLQLPQLPYPVKRRVALAAVLLEDSIDYLNRKGKKRNQPASALQHALTFEIGERGGSYTLMRHLAKRWGVCAPPHSYSKIFNMKERSDHWALQSMILGHPPQAFERVPVASAAAPPVDSGTVVVFHFDNAQFKTRREGNKGGQKFSLCTFLACMQRSYDDAEVMRDVHMRPCAWWPQAAASLRQTLEQQFWTEEDNRQWLLFLNHDSAEADAAHQSVSNPRRLQGSSLGKVSLPHMQAVPLGAIAGNPGSEDVRCAAYDHICELSRGGDAFQVLVGDMKIVSTTASDVCGPPRYDAKREPVGLGNVLQLPDEGHLNHGLRVEILSRWIDPQFLAESLRTAYKKPGVVAGSHWRNSHEYLVVVRHAFRMAEQLLASPDPSKDNVVRVMVLAEGWLWTLLRGESAAYESKEGFKFQQAIIAALKLHLRALSLTGHPLYAVGCLMRLVAHHCGTPCWSTGVVMKNYTKSGGGDWK